VNSAARLALVAAALGVGACQGGVSGGSGSLAGNEGGASGTGLEPPPAGGPGGAAGLAVAPPPTGTAGTSGGAAGRGAAGASAGATGAAGRAPGTAGSGAAGASPTGAAGASAAAGTTGADAGSPPVAVPHCKRGEAYASHSVADLQALSKGVTWWYNWTTTPDKAVAADFQRLGVEFVPMVWGGDPDVAAIVKQIPTSAKYLLGFNEPNFAAQSHIPAAQAAALWPKIEDIARQRNLKIGSPAPNYCAGNCNDTDPIHYLDTFFAACAGCKIDFIAAHWYACTGDALKNYLGKLKKYNLPIWVTEFSCMDDGDHSVAGQEKYMREALAILEADPTIFRYAWFTGRWANPSGVSLLGASGQLTELGDLYLTSPATSTCVP
jgi:hypothetical protein